MTTASRTHARDTDGARRTLATAAAAKSHAAVVAWMDLEARPLDTIAADLGQLMADTAFHGLERLQDDWDAHCKTWGLCGR